jgi:hypothetical protein
LFFDVYKVLFCIQNLASLLFLLYVISKSIVVPGKSKEDIGTEFANSLPIAIRNSHFYYIHQYFTQKAIGLLAIFQN